MDRFGQQTGHDDNNTLINPRVMLKQDAGPHNSNSEQSVYYGSSYYAEKRKDRPLPPNAPGIPRSSARERSRRRNRGRNSLGEWAWVVVAGALLTVVLLVGLSSVIILRANQQEVEIVPTADISLLLPTPVQALTDYSGEIGLDLGETLILDDGSSILLEPWDGQSRFTMVVVGLDRRPGQTGLAFRTDTMMLISIDPQTNQIGILSIPRDLYVDVPGYSRLLRINTPMAYGETSRPGYGPILMMQTVQKNFGIRVNDYMAVDFRAFIDVIDAVGGIEITTTYTINDPLYPDMNYGYDPFYLAAGTHQLDGYDALRFARTRHGDSDIRRAERQQQVLFAVRDKILRLDMIPTLILQAPALWQAWQEHVYTRLTLEQVIQLGLYAKDIPAESIKTGVMDYYYLQPYTTPDGQAVLIPNRSRMPQLMIDVFGQNYNQ